MGRPREDTVRSIVTHGDYVSMKLAVQDDYLRWECSCRERGTWRHLSRANQRAAAVQSWLSHLRDSHPDVELVSAAAGIPAGEQESGADGAST